MNFILAAFDFILHISQHLIALTEHYSAWVYVILFLIIFCETGLIVTPFLPGDSLLFAAGSLAAVGSLNVHLLAVLLIIAAILGDTVNFSLGHYIGTRGFRREKSCFIRHGYLQKTQDFYARHGGKTIVFARFIPIIRTFAPFIAGLSRMSRARFIRYNIVGAILWVALFSYAGYFFGQIPVVKENISLILLDIIVISIAPMALKTLMSYFKIRKQHGC